ncbi:MAG TPA: AAA family ATPase, partial [Polyangiaceae bacterium]|nr:AAA family ATPase [Polyangiaceae bacterium]
ALIVGTPQFVAPEVAHRSALDARTDLFSLGATFYYTITGRSPYAAKTFSELFEAWSTKPLPPSRFAMGAPEALDALILSLLSVDASTRPRTAFEVMQRLAVIADLERAEPVSVSGSYLSSPVMVGRDPSMAKLRNEMTRAFDGMGRGVLIQAGAGLGRSRLLDAAALAAKTLGATVLRADGNATTGDGFRVAETLAEQIVDAAPKAALEAARAENVATVLFEDGAHERVDDVAPKPKLKAFATLASRRVELQSALGRWFLAVSRAVPVALAIDDIHRVDEPSLALLAALVSQANHARLFLVATAELGAEPTDRIAFDVLTKNTTQLPLDPLEREDVDRLFASLFGDVPNVRVLSEGVHAVARGNPRAAMDLAQHLVDKGLVRYAGGAWTLPASLDPADLPARAEEAIVARVLALSPLSRWLAEAHAVASHDGFTRGDYMLLRPDAGTTEIDAALGELVSAQLVVSDGRLYRLAHRGLRAALTSNRDESELAGRHRALVEVYRGRLPIAVVHHSLFGGMEAQALDAIGPLLAETPERTELASGGFSASELAATFDRALGAAERLRRSPREVNELRRWVASLSIFSDSAYYWRAGPAWLEQLKYDSGYSEWEAHPEIVEPRQRLTAAMGVAYQRYAATPEAERVYRPDEAIGGLVRYVTLSIMVATNHLEGSTTNSLPQLLEPFAPISELVHSIWRNA